MTAASDYAGIAEAVDAYARAFHEGDTARLSDLFLSDCKLQFVEGEYLKCFLADDWIRIVGDRPSAAVKGQPLNYRITMLHQAGPGCASAAVEMSTPPNVFYDVLHLLKIDGKWQIAAKSFHRSGPG